MMEVLNTKATFENLIEAANKIQALCSDEVVVADDIRMDNECKIKGMTLSGLAEGELCGKLKIPGRYYTRCREAHRNDLAAANVNAWLENDKRELMLRKFDGHIRGVLSGSYSKYDAPEILDSVREVFGDDHFKIKGSFISEERLHVRLVEKEMLPIEGEDLFAGITLDSSDVGRNGLSVRFFIWKQVCTNGLVVAKSHANLFRQKHIGITHEDFKEGLEDGLASFNELKAEVIEMIQATAKIPLPADLEELTKKIKEDTKLSDDDIVEVFELVDKKYEPTRWGLINGITEVAQKFSLERRIELETLAGNMLA